MYVCTKENNVFVFKKRQYMFELNDFYNDMSKKSQNSNRKSKNSLKETELYFNKVLSTIKDYILIRTWPSYSLSRSPCYYFSCGFHLVGQTKVYCLLKSRAPFPCFTWRKINLVLTKKVVSIYLEPLRCLNLILQSTSNLCLT